MTRALLFWSLFAWGCVSLGWAQSLAEIAEKEKERRAKQKAESVPEYTDKDLQGEKKDEQAESGQASGSESTPAVTDSENGEGGEDSEEESWRQRMRDARQAVDEAKKLVTEIETQMTSVATRRLASTDTMVILPLQEEERRLEKELAQARVEVKNVEKRLRDLEQEARRNHIPPGWLREK